MNKRMINWYKYPLSFGIVLLAFLPGKVHARSSKALIYHGPGACEYCPESFEKLFRDLNVKVQYIQPSQMNDEVFETADFYVQPGGTDRLEDTLDALSKDTIRSLQNFVARGGRYLGTCAGGYLASPHVYDHGRTLSGYGLIPFDSAEEYENSSDSKIEAVNWMGTTVDMYFQDGPFFLVTPQPELQIFARYEASQHVAALMMPFGKGKVGVIGPHPEATQDWFTDENLAVPQELSLKRVKEFIRELAK